MMFWDSSAVVPLLVGEAATAAREAQVRADPVMLVWWCTPVECASALQRLVREGALTAAGARTSEARLRHLEAHWVEVEPTGSLMKRMGSRETRFPLRRWWSSTSRMLASAAPGTAWESSL